MEAGLTILFQYIAEEGSDCVFKAAFIMSNPWDLHAGSLALQRTWFRRNVYSKTLGTSMKGLFETYETVCLGC
jgi:predicted alpha/beta-fold hydrolase